ncbi:hypothetical protein HM131_05900 [Halobacillus mangrovi]|uniref:Uncharacterized protein n=1 Tax=Halobacillus mangrovi TaxID=402384 RepID=A0A1W5ZT22_9BACI|nr:hypothetical protein HM131_05900 [Halobacillus mangrovi]
MRIRIKVLTENFKSYNMSFRKQPFRKDSPFKIRLYIHFYVKNQYLNCKAVLFLSARNSQHSLKPVFPLRGKTGFFDFYGPIRKCKQYFIMEDNHYEYS